MRNGKRERVVRPSPSFSSKFAEVVSDREGEVEGGEEQRSREPGGQLSPKKS